MSGKYVAGLFPSIAEMLTEDGSEMPVAVVTTNMDVTVEQLTSLYGSPRVEATSICTSIFFDYDGHGTSDPPEVANAPTFEVFYDENKMEGKYNSILCMMEGVVSTAKKLRRHLNPGGVVIWFPDGHRS